MISDKEYDFDPQGLMSTRDHYRCILNKILTSAIKLSRHPWLEKEDVIIVLGIIALEAFTDSERFTYSYPLNIITSDIEHIGILGDKKVYFDNRLNHHYL